MILSHLSNKRKEFNMERFDKIFKYFDDKFEILREQVIAQDKVDKLEKQDKVKENQ